MNNFRKKELMLLNKSIQRAKDLASINTEDPQNTQTAYKAACLVWKLAQEYRSERSNYYVSRKRYEASVKRIDLLEAEITEGSEAAQIVPNKHEINRADEWDRTYEKMLRNR